MGVVNQASRNAEPSGRDCIRAAGTPYNVNFHLRCRLIILCLSHLRFSRVMSARGMQVDVSDVPVAVSSLRVEFNGGSGYTNESFARGLMSGIFAAKDFSGLTEAIRQGEKVVSHESWPRDLTGLGLYRTVDINLRRSSKRLCPEVILKLDEKRRPFMKAGISLSSETAEPTLEVAGTMRNLFGNAESLNAQVNFGNKETGSVKLTFQKPK
eukprot:1355312-Amorphochlora_amoeboformis.AAC.1